MKTQKFKKELFRGFLFFLFSFAFCYFCIVDDVNVVSAKKKACTDDMYGDDAIELMFSNESDKNENIYQVSSKKGNFELVGIFEDVGSDDLGNYIEPKASEMFSASDWLYYTETVVKPSKPIYFTVNKEKFTDEDAAGKNVVLKFKLKGDSSCSGAKKLDVEMYTSFSMTNIVAKYNKTTGVKLPTNKWYDSLCGILRGTKSFSDFTTADLTATNKKGEVVQRLRASDYQNYDSSSNALAYYTASFPYCFRDTVSKNLKKKTVIKNIKQVLSAYKSISGIIGEPEYSTEFNTKFNQSKFRAGGIIDSNGSNDAVGCRTTAQLQSGQQPNSCFTAKVNILDDNNTSDENTLNIPTLKCDSNSTTEYRTESGYNFENLKSFYAYTSNSITADYLYHKTGKTWDEDNDRTSLENTDDSVKKEVCKQTCEEAVDVEYGPPVASKAGLCFEYRVKVTSRIKCKSVLNPEGLPDVKEEACAPAPVCHHTSRKVLASRSYVGNGGGPNEDYESCINKCDGGKYTQNCSKECFNEVYGQGTNQLAINYSVQPSKIAKSYDSEFIIKKKGQSQDPWNLDDAYYYVDNNVIRYRGGFALWYYYHRKNRIENSYGIAPGETKGTGYYYDEGITRLSNGGSYICTAECYYIPCGNGYYNQADIDYDVSKNAEEYKSKVTACAISAKCSTRVAEYDMSTQYNDQSVTFGKSQTNSKEDSTGCEVFDVPTLKACQNSGSGTGTNLSGTCANSGVLYDYNGCYRSPCNTDKNKYKDGDKFYETEITYPGTWIKAKTQEISYDQQSSSGWYKENQKFCLPLNTNDVNENWWIWRMNQKAKGNNYQYDSESSSTDNQCSISSSTAKNSTYKEYNNGDAESGIVYNISANIEKFGKFLWNFTVKCFYATNDDGPNIDRTSGDSSSQNENQCSTDEKVRSVDLTDLFPNEGSKADKARTPGFNWSKAATISQEKARTLDNNINYSVDPTALTELIESRGDEIYNNDSKYLDYKFHLTPDILKAIRTYNSDKKYTDYNGEFLTSAADIKKYGLIVYRSNLFYHPSTTGPFTIPENNVLAVGNIGCNNDYSGHTPGTKVPNEKCEYFGNYNMEVN